MEKSVISALVADTAENPEAEQTLLALAEESDPEEVLLQLLEDIETNSDDEKFLVMCRVLLRVLLRLPEKRVNSLGWGLNAIHSYLSKLVLPEDNKLNEEEEILMDADPTVQRITYLLASLLPFYEDLITSCQSGSTDKKIVVLKFTLQLLGKPLAFLDLKSGKTTSKARRLAESIVETIFKLNRDIFAILDLDPSHDIGRVDSLALATLFYLVLSEKVQEEKLPQVYDNVYVFQQAIAMVTHLIEHENQFVQHNGLELTQAILNRVSQQTLSYLLLDSEHHSSFCKAVAHIIVYSSLENRRKKALGLYQQYLFLFDSRGRYLLVYNLMNVLNHTGLIGFTVTQYKDMLVAELNKETPSSYFTGCKLYNILDRFCLLPKKEESDLVELADQIVASLNLLRYLIIRDKKNLTGIRDCTKKLEDNYLETLRKGLFLSRAHYVLKIKDLENDSAEGTKKHSNVSVVVAGQTLTDLPVKEKIKLLNFALTTFDVIENLVCRISELFEM